jgi:N-acetylmuramoyl-L-alanine amidase
MKKVFIDLGHGGTDPGAVGNNLLEKVLTRKIGEYMRSYLKLVYEGVLVKLSRNGDETKSLKQRTDDANAWGADVLTSIHINSATATTANGFESHIYPNSGAPTVALQNLIHAEIMQVMKAFGITNDRGKKQSNFHMLRESKMPSCLTENLFIVNTFDANRLKQEEFLKAVGEAHARGVAKYLGLKEKLVVTQTATVEPVFFSASDLAARVKVIADGVKIYKAPSEQSEVVRTALKEEAFDVYTVQNDWHNVGGANWIKGDNGRNLSLLKYRVIVDDLMYPQARDLVPELQKRFGGNNVYGERK